MWFGEDVGREGVGAEMVQGSAELAWQLICICILPMRRKENAAEAMQWQRPIYFKFIFYLIVLDTKVNELASQTEGLDWSCKDCFDCLESHRT